MCGYRMWVGSECANREMMRPAVKIWAGSQTRAQRGVISGGFGGLASNIALNLSSGRPPMQNWETAIIFGGISGGIVGQFIPVRPGPQPKMSFLKGWPIPGSYVGIKSIETMWGEAIQDTIGAVTPILFQSLFPKHESEIDINTPLPLDLYWSAP